MIPSIHLRLLLILFVLMGATWLFDAVMTGSRARSELAAVFGAQLARVLENNVVFCLIRQP